MHLRKHLVVLDKLIMNCIKKLCIVVLFCPCKYYSMSEITMKEQEMEYIWHYYVCYLSANVLKKIKLLIILKLCILSIWNSKFVADKTEQISEYLPTMKCSQEVYLVHMCKYSQCLFQNNNNNNNHYCMMKIKVTWLIHTWFVHF